MAMGWWNAHVTVGDAKVGLGWRVVDGGPPTDYEVVITVTLPERAPFSVQKKARNETVVPDRDASLTCGPNTIKANVTYHVSRKAGAGGNRVEVKVAKVAGQIPIVTGRIWAVGAGQIGEDITVPVEIPGSC